MSVYGYKCLRVVHWCISVLMYLYFYCTSKSWIPKEYYNGICRTSSVKNVSKDTEKLVVKEIDKEFVIAVDLSR